MAGAQGQRMGPWTLGKRLGYGGNATVWEATRENGDTPVALKVINVARVEREPYQRFVREIEFLREHESVVGLLPVIDAHLPESPTKTDQPWLAMPIATPIGDALEGRPLGDVVPAVASIADTLWRLQRDFGIAHRDIKPGNLYELGGEWLIGDFGLVALPDTDSLTAVGRPLGPRHYTAYEMIRDPSTADPHPADVYSLGKTLWVLATDQRFPPEGHQPVGMRGFEIGDFRPHAHSDVLDREIDLMTRLHPEERPSKEQVARDLAAWQHLASEPVALDVSAARARLREKLALQIAEQDTRAQQKELALAAVRTLQGLTKSLNKALKSLSPRTEIDSTTDELTSNVLKTHGWGAAAVEFRWQRCTLVAPLDGPGSTTLRMSRALELLEDGTLVLHLMVHVGPEGVMGTDFDWQREVTSALVGSVEAERMLQDGARELGDALAQGINVFVEKLPDGSDAS
ncbi:MAG: protein kinase [Pseudonocardiales bacterium]|nr:protein kinase [Pseudonocardiales bacterium]